MKAVDITKQAFGALALLAMAGCGGASAAEDRVQLEVAGPAVDAAETANPARYTTPRPTGNPWDASVVPQTWSMLGREDRAAADGYGEYKPSPCDPVSGSPAGWEQVVDAIAARAADHRVVIVNESHVVTRHRETTRRLLERLRPLGFSVLAAETLTHVAGGRSPIEQHSDLAWPHPDDGYYVIETAFGRLLRQAKALGYRLAPYEQIRTEPPSGDVEQGIALREAAQARHLADILQRMRPDERLIVHVGYSHASEVPVPREGGENEWMAARLKALTGIDPLTISQTDCREAGRATFLAQPPANVVPGQFDIIVAHPLDTFVDHRPSWRHEAGDIATPIPAQLHPTDQPLVIEAFAWDEPFNAVPVDRVFVEPGENMPLLLPPGRYRVRAVRLTEQ